MMYKYGELTQNQIIETKEYMRKRIFFLLLIVDENTKQEYKNIDVNEAFDNMLTKFGGLNSILNYPKELVDVISLLEAAKIEYNKKDFAWHKYRKLILDAGNEVLSIKEV